MSLFGPAVPRAREPNSITCDPGGAFLVRSSTASRTTVSSTIYEHPARQCTRGGPSRCLHDHILSAREEAVGIDGFAREELLRFRASQPPLCPEQAADGYSQHSCQRHDGVQGGLPGSPLEMRDEARAQPKPLGQSLLGEAKAPTLGPWAGPGTCSRFSDSGGPAAGRTPAIFETIWGIRAKWRSVVRTAKPGSPPAAERPSSTWPSAGRGRPGGGTAHRGSASRNPCWRKCRSKANAVVMPRLRMTEKLTQSTRLVSRAFNWAKSARPSR